MASKRLFLSGIVMFVLFSFTLIISVGASSVMWSQTYGNKTYGFGHEHAFSLVETSDGGYALAGYIWIPVPGDQHFLVVKTNEFGIIPEFPSWMILPLFFIATLLALLARKAWYS